MNVIVLNGLEIAFRAPLQSNHLESSPAVGGQGFQKEVAQTGRVKSVFMKNLPAPEQGLGVGVRREVSTSEEVFQSNRTERIQQLTQGQFIFAKGNIYSILQRSEAARDWLAIPWE